MVGYYTNLIFSSSFRLSAKRWGSSPMISSPPCNSWAWSSTGGASTSSWRKRISSTSTWKGIWTLYLFSLSGYQFVNFSVNEFYSLFYFFSLSGFQFVSLFLLFSSSVCQLFGNQVVSLSGCHVVRLSVYFCFQEPGCQVFRNVVSQVSKVWIL